MQTVGKPRGCCRGEHLRDAASVRDTRVAGRNVHGSAAYIANLSVFCLLLASISCGAKQTFAAPSQQIAIVHVHYRAGDDNFNKNGEWVEIENQGGESVDLTGWTLHDEGNKHSYRFPKGFRLPAKGRVKVFTGDGEDTGSELYWRKKGSAVWNNSGDTAYLLDERLNLVDTCGWTRHRWRSSTDCR